MTPWASLEAIAQVDECYPFDSPSNIYLQRPTKRAMPTTGYTQSPTLMEISEWHSIMAFGVLLVGWVLETAK
jgi:hypothetical protein